MIIISIYYSKSTKQWRVKKNGSVLVAYGESSNGKYAKLLAKLSDKTNIKHKNYITFDDKYLYIHMYSKMYGYKSCIINKENYNLICNYRWYIKKQHNNFYCETSNQNSKLKIHKLITQTKEENIVDHINRDGLDNRSENLRIVTTSINGRNAMKYSTNTTGFTGVSYSESQNRFYIYWSDNNLRFCSKTLYVSDRKSYEDCLQMAIVIRFENATKYDYKFSQEDLETYKKAKEYVENIV